MTVSPASFRTDQRYGSTQNNDEESDDEMLKESPKTHSDEKDSKEDDDENLETNELNSKVFSEVELAAKSRADTTIIRATEHENEDSPHKTINPNSSYGSNPKTIKDDVEETMSEQTLKDAAEFENLLFSVRRQSARSRLLKFISTLKRLSAKFQREEEVKEVLQQMNANLNSIPPHATITKSESPSKRSNNSKSDEATEPSKKRIRIEDDSSQTPIFADTALTNASLHKITNGSKIGSKTTTVMTATVPRSNPPSLKEKDEWVKLHQSASPLICPDYTVNNTCPLGSNCPRKHVYKPPKNKPNLTPMTKDLYSARKLRLPSFANTLGWYSRIDLERVYDTYRKTILTKDSFSDKIKPDELNVSYYTSCFTCPVDKTVYYSQPFPGDLFVNGNKSSQGIWWYLNIKDARDAVVTHVIRHLQQRKIVPLDFKPDMRTEEEVKMMKKKNAAKAANVLALSSMTSATSTVTKPTKKAILASVLPNINPWNWAELDYQSRCVLFNTPQSCSLGCHCKFAHVHYPQNVITDRFPPKQALPLAYNQHFNLFIEDAFFQPVHQRLASSVFHVKTIVDSHNQIWYTAAWICPHEKTIYYAAGGTTGRSNPQGFVVYPSVEEAKFAVCGIVLNAFFSRGLRGAWCQGYLS